MPININLKVFLSQFVGTFTKRSSTKKFCFNSYKTMKNLLLEQGVMRYLWSYWQVIRIFATLTNLLEFKHNDFCINHLKPSNHVKCQPFPYWDLKWELKMLFLTQGIVVRLKQFLKNSDDFLEKIPTPRTYNTDF